MKVVYRVIKERIFLYQNIIITFRSIKDINNDVDD
jgi:hypothetical protein